MSKKTRFKRYHLTGLLVLLVVGLSLATLPLFAVSAQGTVSVSVGSASGNVNTTVDIPVTISNRPGAAGTEFIINYNSAVVEPQRIDIRWGTIFQGLADANIISDGKLKIAIIAANAFSSDGTLATIPFKLKSGGQTNLAISALKVTGTDGFAISSTGNSGSITVNVPKTQLAQVGKPSWNGNNIAWIPVTGAASYQVKLYKTGSLARTVTVNHPNRTFDFASDMSGAGRYTVTVQALAGSSQLYTDGPVSTVSDANVKTEPLAQVTKPSWNGNTINWSAVSGAASYRVILHKDGSPNETVSVSATSYNFSDRINQQGLGSYTVTVQARAALSDLYTDGPVSSTSDANVKSAILARADKPTWSGDTISWSAVSGAASYQVRLFKNGSLNHTVSTGGTSYNFSTRINQEGAGNYTVTVQALAAPAEPHVNGPGSLSSDANVKTVTLTRVARPAWSGNRITWNGVAGALNYEVKLYKGSTLVDTRTVAAGTLSYDFKSRMNQIGAGNYSATVQARGDGNLYFHGEISERSGRINYDPEAEASPGGTDPGLPDVELSAKPVWLSGSGDKSLPFTIAWRRGADTVEKYTITLYRGNDIVTTLTVTPGDEDTPLSYNFSDHITEPGLYHVVIDEHNSGGGSVSLENSTILVVTAENGAGSGIFQAEGFLPFAGVWLRITSETAVSGVMTLYRLADSEQDNPEERFPAGIFLNIDLDQVLLGVSVRIEVDYDPALLPQGVNEDTLRLYRFDLSTGSWRLLDSGVNIAQQHVWAVVEQFSVIGVFGEAHYLPLEGSAGFSWSFLNRVPYYLWLILIIIVATSFVLKFQRRKPYRRR